VRRDTLWLLCSQNAVMKLAGFGAILETGRWVFPGLYNGDWRPLWLAVLALTAVGTAADVTLVPRLGNVPSLALGWIGMTAIVWLAGLLFPGTAVPIWQAALVSVFFAPFEFTLHRFVLARL
jgi:hypothetical protein